MDYKNGKIYAIRSHQTDEIYIGSTTQPLSKRISSHKSGYKRYLDGLCNSVTSFKILQYDDAYIELFEEYPCDNKIMLNKREGEIIRQNNCVNKCIAGQTNKEYREQNKDKIKEYREQNKDKIKDYNKEYKEQNKDKIKEYIKEYYEQNKDKKKEYYEKNKDKKKEYDKKYRENKKLTKGDANLSNSETI